jgi:hypothetical protein
LQLDGATYSVPERLARCHVHVFAGPFAIDIEHDGVRVCLCRVRFGERRVRYLHYARSLSQKPQALRQVAQALLTEMGEPFVTSWKALVDAHDELHAARLFRPVLVAVDEHGLHEAARLVEQRALKGLSGLGARAPPLDATSSLAVPARLDVVVQASPLDIYDAITGALP